MKKLDSTKINELSAAYVISAKGNTYACEPCFCLIVLLEVGAAQAKHYFRIWESEAGFLQCCKWGKNICSTRARIWRQLYRVFLNLTFPGQIFRLLLKHDFSYFDFERNMYMPAFW